MDSQAAQAHTDPNIPQETRHPSTIRLNGKVLTGKLTTSLWNEINTLPITNYYKQKFRENHEKALWDVFYGAVLHYKLYSWTKFFNGYVPSVYAQRFRQCS
jgi:hypothetical protein